jgi:hypothetical protein
MFLGPSWYLLTLLSAFPPFWCSSPLGIDCFDCNPQGMIDQRQETQELYDNDATDPTNAFFQYSHDRQQRTSWWLEAENRHPQSIEEFLPE